MAEWMIQHREHDGTILDEFKPAEEINLEFNKSTPCSASYSLGRSDPDIGVDRFAPYRTDCFIYRDAELIMSGPHTSRKWDADNEGVVQIGMNDWMHLLEKLYMPVTVTVDNMDVANRKLAYKMWGVNIPPYDEATRYGIALGTITQEMLDYRNAVDDLQWTVVQHGGPITTKAFHEMAGLDGKTMYDHIKELAEMHLGFDWVCVFNDTNDIEVHLWHPTRDSLTPVWSFENTEDFASFVWEDTGPIATRTFGLGQGHGPVARLADVSVYTPSDDTYRQLEIQSDVGEIADLYQYDDIADDEEKAIRKLTGAMGQRNRYPQHTVECSFYTDIFPSTFFTNFHAGDRFNIDLDMGFHHIDSDYLMVGYSAKISPGGDELITPNLEKREALQY